MLGTLTEKTFNLRDRTGRKGPKWRGEVQRYKLVCLKRPKA